MTPEVELKFVQGLRAYACNNTFPVPCVVPCSGCNIKVKADEALSRFWKERYGIAVDFQQLVHAEKDEAKQKFSLREFPHVFENGVMVADMNELADDSVQDVRGFAKLLPRLQSLGSGFPCTSRTPMSSSMKDNINCVQEGKGATGQGLASILKILDKHPDVEEVLLECVVQLGQKVPSSSQSDSEYIVSQLQNRRFWSIHVELEALEHGSCIPRHRLWWTGLKDVSDHAGASQYFLSVLSTLKMPRDSFGLDLVFSLSDSDRRSEAQTCGLPCLADFGERLVKRTKLDMEYKTDHLSFCRRFSFPWPFDPSQYAGLVVGGMLPREQEVAVILNEAFPMPQRGRVQFIDVNSSLVRLCNGCFDEESGEIKKSPWKDRPPTLTGSTKLLLRYRLDSQGDEDETSDGVTIRVADAHEYMRCIGWDIGTFSAKTVEPKYDDAKVAFATTELHANMVGNAWSMFQYIPLKMSLVATAGMYQHQARNDNKGASSSSGAASSGAVTVGNGELAPLDIEIEVPSSSDSD